VTRLRQVLANLLSNAVKFTERGEVVVTVSGKPLGKRNVELHFSVRDTGIGIPGHRLSGLFRPFTQGDSSTTRKYGGTGLGLVISRRLVEMMGGRLWAESVAGQGSTFHFTIVGEPTQAGQQSTLRGHQANLAGRRVMVVDDNDVNRSIVSRQLAAWGMTSTVFASAADALAAIQNDNQYDLALLDMHMPEMNGLDLAAALHKQPPLRGLPLVMLTSLGSSDIGDAKSDFAATLTKPVKASQMYNTLVTVLHGASSLPSEPQPPSIKKDMGQEHPLRILLAEDNTINQKVALRLLDRMGYRADAVSNGAEAVAAIQRQPYDVIFMDVQMPEMDGLEATGLIRMVVPADRQPTIIAMTAAALPEDRDRCIKAGMDSYMSKPFSAQQLADALAGCRQVANTTLASEDGEEQPAIDEAILFKFARDMGGDESPEAVLDVTDLYLRDTPAMLGQMHAALGTGNAAALQRVAHTLKSSSAMLGATALAQLCTSIEAMATERRLDGAAQDVSLADAEFVRVRTALAEATRKWQT
jgi:CheY-like chemotaxis protein